MRIDLKAWLYAMRASFWAIPIVMALAAIVAAFAIMEADLAIGRKQLTFPPAMTMPIESARLALSTIAGSMITIASLVFSMTLVALTLVSQQLGPRILLFFMDDRETQIMLGLFVATFIFALIVLLRVGDEALGGRVPSLAVLLTAGLAIFALGMMTRFIHHIATRIQADVVIAALGRDLKAAASGFADQGADSGKAAGADELEQIDKQLSGDALTHVALETSGYLRRMDTDTACSLACEHDLLIAMQVRPGQFVLAGTPILAVCSNNGDADLGNDLQRDIACLVTVGERRTPEASVEFEISALVEVALRALSPGINDPFTACACIDRLAVGLLHLMDRDSERRVHRDDDGVIRVVHTAEPFSRYLSSAFDAIAHAGRNQPVVLEKLSATLASLEQIAGEKTHKTEIKRLRDAVAGA